MFSLEWFKKENREKLESLIIHEQELKNKLLEEKLGKTGSPSNVKPEGKIYRHLKLVNDELTVIFIDGSILTKSGATVDDFNKVKNASSEGEIIRIVSSASGIEQKIKEREKQERDKKIYEGMDILSTMSEFEIKDGSVYLKGISRTLPPLLVEQFSVLATEYQDAYEVENGLGWEEAFYKDEEYLSLKRFFLWCCLNPRAEVASDLYDFLMKNSFRITKQGFFVALRNVVSLEKTKGSNLKVQFISNAYNKVKAVWKKKPEDYEVYEFKGNYGFRKIGTNGIDAKATILGNLKDLYLDLPNMEENRFTDDFTRTFDIRIGQVVSMPKEECSWSRRDCAAAGLHFTADQIHYVGCGDTSVLVLINPMKVVGIGESKGRCYEYLPIMTVPSDEATELLHDLDFDTLELDEDFAIRELENLTEKVKDGIKAETTKFKFNISGISSTEILTIVSSLDEMKKEISKRITSLK